MSTCVCKSFFCWGVFALTGLMVLLHFARVARVFVFSYRGRTKTRATWVNSKECPILNRNVYFCPLCPRKVEIILSDIVLAKKIFARVARVARVSDLALHDGLCNRGRPVGPKAIS